MQTQSYFKRQHNSESVLVFKIECVCERESRAGGITWNTDASFEHGLLASAQRPVVAAIDWGAAIVGRDHDDGILIHASVFEAGDNFGYLEVHEVERAGELLSNGEGHRRNHFLALVRVNEAIGSRYLGTNRTRGCGNWLMTVVKTEIKTATFLNAKSEEQK